MSGRRSISGPAAVMAAAVFAVLAVLAAPSSVRAQTVEPGLAAARLQALLEVVSSGDAQRMTAFVETWYAPRFRSDFPADVHVSYLLDLWRSSGGPDGVGPGEAAPGVAGVRLSIPLTEEIDSLWIELDAAPPHGIARIGRRTVGSVSLPAIATDADVAAELERYVAKLAAADAFSGVVLLARHGRPIVFQAVGIANRDFDAPVRRDTKFNLGSANKNFTAIVIGQLVDEGRLSWDDPLSKFLPDFPDPASAARVRLKHLLSHTSGLGSYFNARFMNASRARFRTVTDFMELARPDSLRFEPGTAWWYSNTGYLVLGRVIEVVTGRSYDEVVRERITRPLGMTGTDTYALDRVNPNLAVGYIREAGPSGTTYRNNLFEHVIQGGPAGGGYSTAEDLLTYAEALRAGRLVRPETLALMRSPKPELASPRYGYGFIVTDDVWGHGGDFPGIDADLNVYGESGWVAIVLANYDRVNDPILRRIRALLERRP